VHPHGPARRGGRRAAHGDRPLRLALGLTGATVLLLLGARTLWSAFRVRLGDRLLQLVDVGSGLGLLLFGGILGARAVRESG
jgi:putative LysE/RhtB family amino acid efflux pump